MMQGVIQSLGWYFPEHTGGTEVYVASLIAALRSGQFDSVVAAPSASGHEEHGDWQGTPVYRYPVPPQSTIGQRLGHEPHAQFERFDNWLGQQQARIYHQHSWTFGCGAHHLRAANRRGLRTVLTVHVAGPLCLRGSMMYEGRAQCERAIDERTCAACWLQSRGMPAPARALVSRLPAGVGALVRPMRRWGTAAAAPALARAHRESLLDAAHHADRVVAVCEWLRSALVRNGVPSEKVSLNRQGVATLRTSADDSSHRTAASDRGSLKVGFLGRWDSTKGLHVLVEAMLHLPRTDRPVELDVVAVPPADAQMRAYMQRVQAQASQCTAIRFHSALTPQQVPDFLASLDVLAVPSQLLETGPLVVLESFAAGTPVLGSDLGGIRELVRDRVNGRLLPHDDPKAWSSTIAGLAASREALVQLRSGIGPVRTMSDVATQTRQLYDELLERP